jgi:isoleucyl-tRNA synthetase
VQAEKELGIAGHPEILEFGVDAFNDACRTSVLRYTQEWRTT